MRCFTFKNGLLIYLEKYVFQVYFNSLLAVFFIFSEQNMEEVDSVKFKSLLEESNVPSTYSADNFNIDGWISDLFSYCSYGI